MFVTKDEIRQIANDIIVDDINNDILFIIANKGFGKNRLLNEIYGRSFNANVIIVNGEQFHSDSVVRNCIIHGIFEYLRRNNSIDNRLCLCKIISKFGKPISIPKRILFNIHIKVKEEELEQLLAPFSINNLIDTYSAFSNNTPLVLFIKGIELCEADNNHLKQIKAGKGTSRLTYIIALRPDENGLNLIKKVCQTRNERIWICPLLPEVKNSISNHSIVDIPVISLTGIQDSYSYQDFKTSIRFKDYYIPVFELVSKLLSSNINPAMIFTVANQEIEQDQFTYINDIAIRLLHEPVAPRNSDALIPHNEKYMWVDALAYYLFINEGMEELLLELQKFYFAFLIDTNHWKDILEEYEYRYGIAASVLNMDDRNKMNDLLKSMSHIPTNPLIPGISTYTSKLSDWIRTFSRPAVAKKAHFSSTEQLIDELVSFRVGFSDVNVAALLVISNETGRLGSLDIALIITANKLRTKPELTATEKNTINDLIKKSLEESIRWNDITLVEEVCDVLILLKQANSLGTYSIPEITNNHTIHRYLNGILTKHNFCEGEIIMGRKTIFISYTNADVDIVDIIDKHLTECGYNVKRDIRNIGDYGSIEKFMNSIRKQDFVVPIISDTYLRRNNCMYEISQLIKDENYPERTFPVIVDLAKTGERNYSFFSPLYRVEMIKYWEDETQVLIDKVNTISEKNRGELDFEIRRYSNYAESIASFLDWLKNVLVGLVPSEEQKSKRKQRALEISEKIDSRIISTCSQI